MGSQLLQNIYPKSLECDSRLGVTECQGLLRLETLSNSLSTNLTEVGKPDIDLFASRLNHQVQKYVAWRPDPYSWKTDAMQQSWDHQFLYAFPPFSLINKVLNKIQEDKVHLMLLITPTWHTTTSVVPRASSNVSGETFIAATNEKTFNKSPRRSAFVDKKPNLAISGVEGFRKSLAKKGLSDTASKLISNSRRDGSISNYDSSWRKWACWCSGRKHDPFRCNVNGSIRISCFTI